MPRDERATSHGQLRLHRASLGPHRWPSAGLETADDQALRLAIGGVVGTGVDPVTYRFSGTRIDPGQRPVRDVSCPDRAPLGAGGGSPRGSRGPVTPDAALSSAGT
jgi:hypothetical protein